MAGPTFSAVIQVNVAACQRLEAWKIHLRLPNHQCLKERFILWLALPVVQKAGHFLFHSGKSCFVCPQLEVSLGEFAEVKLALFLCMIMIMWKGDELFFQKSDSQKGQNDVFVKLSNICNILSPFLKKIVQFCVALLASQQYCKANQYLH